MTVGLPLEVRLHIFSYLPPFVRWRLGLRTVVSSVYALSSSSYTLRYALDLDDRYRVYIDYATGEISVRLLSYGHLTSRVPLDDLRSELNLGVVRPAYAIEWGIFGPPKAPEKVCTTAHILAYVLESEALILEAYVSHLRLLKK